MEQLSLFEQMQQLHSDPTPVKVDVSSLKKVYYTISEVAEMFRVNASLLRFWEKEFPTQLGHVKKNKKGDRYYNKKDIERLTLLFYLVKEKKMTLEGARTYLKNNRKRAKSEFEAVENLKKIRNFLVELKNSLK